MLSGIVLTLATAASQSAWCYDGGVQNRSYEFSSRNPMAVEYNHDLAVSEEFLEAFPALRVALRDQRLIVAFEVYEAQAERHKQKFHLLGVSSLLSGLLTLAATAVEVVVGRPLSDVLGWGTVLVQFGSVASIILVVISRLSSHRARWCQAVFHRERLRQWHFQQFLDGELISLLPERPAEFEQELDRRWQTLLQSFRDGYGAMSAFVTSGTQKDDLFHRMTPYADATLLNTVLEVMRICDLITNWDTDSGNSRRRETLPLWRLRNMRLF